MSNTKKKLSSDILINKLIFKKYRIIKLISEGVFGNIFLVINEKTRDFYSMKREKKDSSFHILQQEAYNLYSIKGLGIPELITFGKIGNDNILIEQALGKSLLELFNENKYSFSIKDICLISIQLIDRIEWIHNKTLVHRDIRPDIFFIGLKDPNIVYLTELGLSVKYCSSKTRKHIMPGFKGRFTGTLKFSSSNAQRGNQQSRRDDIESLGYTILFFLKGQLPWENMDPNLNAKELYLKTYAMKKYMPIEKLCKGLPEMEDYFKYSRSLKFQEKPDYEYLRNIFKDLLKKNGFENFENLYFSWVEPSKNNFQNNKKTRTLSPKARLFMKIKNQIQLKKEIESDNKNIDGVLLTDNNLEDNIINNINQRISLTQEKREKQNQNGISKTFINNNASFKATPKRENNEKDKFQQIKIKNRKESIQNKEKKYKIVERSHTTKEQNKNKNIYNTIKNEERMNNYKKINKNNLIKNKNFNIDPINIEQINNNKINFEIDNNITMKKINQKINNYHIYNNKNTSNENSQFNDRNIKLNKMNESNKNYYVNPLILNYGNLNYTTINNEDNINLNLIEDRRYSKKNNEHIMTENNKIIEQINYKNLNNNKYMNIHKIIKNNNLANENFKIKNINTLNFNNRNIKLQNNF